MATTNGESQGSTDTQEKTETTSPKTDGKAPERKPDNTVRTRQATDAERQPGAKIEVGKADAVKPDSSEKGDGDGDGGNGEVHPERATLEARMNELQNKKSGLSAKESKELQGIRTQLGIGDKASSYDRARAQDKSRAPKAAKTATVRKFPEALSADVKTARYDLSAKNPKLGEGKHVPGSSAGDHTAVRERVTEILTNPAKRPEWATKVLGDTECEVTPETVLKVSGIKSHKKLREIATWSTPKEDMEGLRTLGGEFKGPNSGWRSGRYLAAILVVFIERIKTDAKAEAKKEKAAA